MARPYCLAVGIVIATLLPAACKFVKNDTETPPDQGGVSANSDSATGIDARWDAEVMPHLESTATDLLVLKAMIAKDLAVAGTQHGHRSNSEGSPWSFPVRFSGTIVNANTESRAATADIDVDGDGTADATVQLGPVIKGTTLRDVLPFIDFTAFRDQIEFAQLSRAFNTRAYETTLSDFPREALVGKQVSVLGAFTIRNAADAILVTPVVLAPVVDP